MNNIKIVLCFFIACYSCTREEAQSGAILTREADLIDLSFRSAVPMSFVSHGEYIPLYGRDSLLVKIVDFKMDNYPVTNADYLSFVKNKEKWRKSNVKRLFADQNYLSKWQNDTTLGNEMKPNSPATNISWYAAREYCECQGKRLPTVDEWEYAAMADEKIPDARRDSSYNQKILDWYETPRSVEKEIGNTFKNYWGIYDLHGLVWEWTSDFNSILFSGESRNDVTTDNSLFCGSGSLNANDLMNYAAFMRYSFRSSIQANYSIQNLGFRCVKDTILVK